MLLADRWGGRGYGSTGEVAAQDFPPEHGKIGAWERFCAFVYRVLFGAGGEDDFGRDGSGYGVEWALAGR